MNKKRDDFIRLGEARVMKAKKAIALIGNLSNKYLYDYSESDVKKITATLREDLVEVERRLMASVNMNEKEVFKL